MHISIPTFHFHFFRPIMAMTLIGSAFATNTTLGAQVSNSKINMATVMKRSLCNQSFCNNRGTCTIEEPIQLLYCECYWLYSGSRCEKANLTVVIAAVVATVELLLIFLLAVLLCICCHRNRKYKRLTKGVFYGSSISYNATNSVPIRHQCSRVYGTDMMQSCFGEFAKRYSLPSELQIPRPQIMNPYQETQ
uniref:EGF-like domain-containing protein n=1 Tax=Trichuris muris TaxID=70415 RepID=A0A5S6QMG3_TRIMR